MGYGFQHDGKTYTPDGEPPRVETPEECDARNRQLAVAEVEAFKGRAADRWFAYWQDAKPGAQPNQPIGVLPNCPRIATWMGDALAFVTWWGGEYHSYGFGSRSTRVNFRAKGIDGRAWAGTYYKSTGDYVRMRVVKGGA